MITPRSTRLVRADDLAALHRELLSLATRGDLTAVRRRAIIVPSRAAAEQLRNTLENLSFSLYPAGDEAALVLPDLLTRGEWYQRMHEDAGEPEPLLRRLEREVLLAAAARDAVAEGVRPPFRLRPGLIGEMLAFYDALRGQQRSVDAFERIVTGDLEPRTETDRGAERLLRQTRFLVAAFRAYERRVVASGRVDEHLLRRRLLDGDGDRGSEDPRHREGRDREEHAEGGRGGGPTGRYTHVVVTVGDRTAEPEGGLYPADYDLLMRLPGIEAIHLVATRGQLASGLGERLHDLIPELEERETGHAEPGPRLLAPTGDEERLHFVARDREEELRAIARWIKHEARSTEPPGQLDRVAVVFKRPLPYVYLARTVFESAGIEHQTSDALPLASEPMAAVLDLVVTCVETRFARAAITALLRCPHLADPDAPNRPAAQDVDAFDRRLAESAYLGDPNVLLSMAAAWQGEGTAAARAAAGFAQALQPLEGKQPISVHTAALLAVLQSYERLTAPDEAVRSRHLRARSAVYAAIDELRRAAVDFDDPVADLSGVASIVRRSIESLTFSPRRGEGGVQFVDAQAARYGTFDAAFLAGLAEGDWPEPQRRNIFYPAFLLSQLGWPSEAGRLSAARAAFADLLRLPQLSVRVSTFTLEDDSIVNPSALIEDLARSGLRVDRADDPDVRVFADEALMAVPPVAGTVEGDARAWLDVREGRSSAATGAFHGAVGPVERPSHSVTAIDQYLQCPFKYFAGKVMMLPEEVVDEPTRTPRARGQFVHEVLCDFFTSWQASGGGSVTADNLDEARQHFAQIAEHRLAALPPAEAGLERLRLLGSIAAPGVAEIVLAAEASRATPVRERLLEHALEGEFTIEADGISRRVRLRGKADRIDLLEDGRFRVIDYKNGKQPDLAQTIQLPIYAVCVRQQLARTRGGRWDLAEAGYLAFGDRRPDRVIVCAGPEGARRLAEGQARLLEAIDGIERGDFPPRPAAPRLCGTCAYAAVCRKDVVDAD